jgi:hypothetical protein
MPIFATNKMIDVMFLNHSTIPKCVSSQGLEHFFLKKGVSHWFLSMANTTKRRFWKSIYCQLPGHCTERVIFFLPTRRSTIKHDENLPDFIPKAECPPRSQDLNPLDFSS